jgi:hypothetical protein
LVRVPLRAAGAASKMPYKSCHLGTFAVMNKVYHGEPILANLRRGRAAGALGGLPNFGGFLNQCSCRGVSTVRCCAHSLRMRVIVGVTSHQKILAQGSSQKPTQEALATVFMLVRALVHLLSAMNSRGAAPWIAEKLRDLKSPLTGLKIPDVESKWISYWAPLFSQRQG